MQWWYLYVVGAFALALVVFAHVDERLRNRRHRSSMEKIEDRHRNLTGAVSQRNDFTSVGS